MITTNVVCLQHSLESLNLRWSSQDVAFSRDGEICFPDALNSIGLWFKV